MMNMQAEKKLGELVEQLQEDRAALIELRETLPILIAGLTQIVARMDIHDEIMRLCMTED